MELDQLIRRFHRLQRELVVVSSTVPRQTGRINRLLTELAGSEREIQALRSSTQPNIVPPLSAIT